MARIKEGVEQKAQRLVDEGGVRKVRDGEYLVRGSRGREYTVLSGSCGCDARVARCSHAIATEIFEQAEREAEIVKKVRVELEADDIRAVLQTEDPAAVEVEYANGDFPRCFFDLYPTYEAEVEEIRRAVREGRARIVVEREPGNEGTQAIEVALF